MIADVTSWRPSVRAFDLVAVFSLHLPPGQRRDAHRVAASAVAPGGVLLVVGHDRDNLEHGVGGPQEPDILFSADEVTADLDDTGLTVVTARQVHRRVDVDGRTRTAIDCLVRAHRPADEDGGR